MGGSLRSVESANGSKSHAYPRLRNAAILFEWSKQRDETARHRKAMQGWAIKAQGN